MAVKMEKQLNQNGTIQQIQSLNPLKPWKPNQKDKSKGDPSQQKEQCKTEFPREKKDTSTILKGNNVTLTSRNCDIKCFCCLGFGHIA